MARFFSRHLFAVSLLVSLAQFTVHAAENFKMFTQPLLINSERGEVTSYVVLADNKRYNFLPPIGWNVSANATDKTITFLSEDLSASIVLRFVADSRKTLEGLRSDAARAEIAARYPDSKIEHNFPCHTSGKEGHAFDVQRLQEDRPPVSIRVAFVPFDESMVEFTLTTETKRFAKYHWTLANLMTSFRIDSGVRPRIDLSAPN